MYNYTRKSTGRYGKKKLNWTRICDDAVFIVLGVGLTYTIADITLRAHGL